MSSTKPQIPLLVSEGGNVNLLPDLRDPFEALDDLMHVVEALCPAYPAREIFSNSAIFKL